MRAAQVIRLPVSEPLASVPLFEVRMVRHGVADLEIEVWQLPCRAVPHLKAPLRLAGLRGRNLDLVERHVLSLLAQAGVPVLSRAQQQVMHAIAEDHALRMGLLFRVLAPMRSYDNIRAVAEGIAQMSREEAGYWLGMAMYRRHPRRVLTALRYLLTDPHRKA